MWASVDGSQNFHARCEKNGHCSSFDTIFTGFNLLFWFCLFTNYHHCLGYLVISGLPLPENQNLHCLTITFKFEFRIQLSSKITSGTESKLWRFSSAAAGWKPPLISPCNNWITRGSPLLIINRYFHLSIKAKISQHSDLYDKPPGSLRDGRHQTPSAPLCLLDPLKACKRTFVYIKFGQKESKSNVQITQSIWKMTHPSSWPTLFRAGSSASFTWELAPCKGWAMIDGMVFLKGSCAMYLRIKVHRPGVVHEGQVCIVQLVVYLEHGNKNCSHQCLYQYRTI